MRFRVGDIVRIQESYDSNEWGKQEMVVTNITTYPDYDMNYMSLRIIGTDVGIGQWTELYVRLVRRGA